MAGCCILGRSYRYQFVLVSRRLQSFPLLFTPPAMSLQSPRIGLVLTA